MSILQTLIVDDEAVARSGLRKMLQAEDDVAVVGECSTGREAVDAIHRLTPDLVFMDVQMPEMNGFEALRAVEAEALPIVVFVTAYDQYALRAFEVHAVDYLLKPFTMRRLQEALAEARKRFDSDRVEALNTRIQTLLQRLDTDAGASPAGGYLERIPVKKRRQVTFIPVERIDWLEAADNYVDLHVGADSHLVRSTLTEMEERLNPDRFLRIHRSYIVNVDRIRELHPRGSGDCEIVLHDGTHLRSSRTYSERRREVLDVLS